jgi:2-polyprenyl-6-methoxyphenol hydroxylase-like FAD-dependent oxidoreductase
MRRGTVSVTMMPSTPLLDALKSAIGPRMNVLAESIFMSKIEQTEVLVVGAGPAGMFTALLLAQNGIKTQIIDQESRTAAHSYSCALHPRTHELLRRTRVTFDAIEFGHHIDTVGFYEGNTRRAEAKLSDLPVKFPFALVLAQSTLENFLEQRLRHAGVKIHWNHRLANVEMNGQKATATIEKLADIGKGFITPEFVTAVERELRTEARFVVGADGFNSIVRQRLGIQCQRVGDPQYYVVYEVEADGEFGHEAKAVFDDGTCSVFWPLSGTRCRWSFQLKAAREPKDFPQKARAPLMIVESASNHDSLHHLRQLLKERAPWFQNAPQEVVWAVDVQFEPWLARHFGKEQCWLVGDAAHQTGPVGMQSMNIGFREAADLTDALTQILRKGGSKELLQTYERTHSIEWQRLLGLRGAVQVTDKTAPWVRQHATRIVGSIPASGDDLDYLLKRLEIELA